MFLIARYEFVVTSNCRFGEGFYGRDVKVIEYRMCVYIHMLAVNRHFKANIIFNDDVTIYETTQRLHYKPEN